MKTKKKTKRKGTKKVGGNPFNRIWWQVTSAKAEAANTVTAVELVDPKQFHKVRKAFNNFSLFTQPDDMQVEWRPITTTGVNGNVYIVKYANPEQQAFALLKQSKGQDTDNLMLEYYSGILLNKYYDVLPSFVYTYDIYTAGGDPAPIVMPDERKSPNYSYVQGFNRKKHLQERLSLKTACDPKIGLNNLLLLTQYVQHAQPFESMLIVGKTSVKNDAQFFPIFFQIMYSLYVVNYYQGFEHNDLHGTNILIYTLPRPVRFTFHMANLSDNLTPSERRKKRTGLVNPPGRGRKHEFVEKIAPPKIKTWTVSFESSFFPRIIDYGQCTSDESPLEEFNKTKECYSTPGFHSVFVKKTKTIIKKPALINPDIVDPLPRAEPPFIINPIIRIQDNYCLSEYLKSAHGVNAESWSLFKGLTYLEQEMKKHTYPKTPLLGELTVDGINVTPMQFVRT